LQRNQVNAGSKDLISSNLFMNPGTPLMQVNVVALHAVLPATNGLFRPAQVR
jgi:hypothetical protein